MKITLEYNADKAYTATNSTGNQVKIDMLDAEEKQHQSPTELLLSSVAACAAVDMVLMIRKRRKTFVDLRAEVEGTRRDEHPRGFTKIHLHYTLVSPDLTEEEAARIVELATTKYCSVAASLSADQTHSFTIERPA